MGQQATKLAKETGYELNDINRFEKSYETLTSNKKDRLTSSTLFLRFDIDFDVATIMLNSLNSKLPKQKKLNVSFSDVVIGMAIYNHGSILQKIEYLWRALDPQRQGFIVARDMRDFCLRLMQIYGSSEQLGKSYTIHNYLPENGIKISEKERRSRSSKTRGGKRESVALKALYHLYTIPRMLLS